MALRIERATTALPAGFASLCEEAQAGGHSHLQRLAADWMAGAARFDRAGEALLAARVDGVLAGIAGMTHDPVESGALRLRRFYVALAFRRQGIGRVLAETLLTQREAAGRAVLLNAAPGSVAFWASLGFVAEPRDGHTHRLAVDKRAG